MVMLSMTVGVCVCVHGLCIMEVYTLYAAISQSLAVTTWTLLLNPKSVSISLVTSLPYLYTRIIPVPFYHV